MELNTENSINTEKEIHELPIKKHVLSGEEDVVGRVNPDRGRGTGKNPIEEDVVVGGSNRDIKEELSGEEVKTPSSGIANPCLRKRNRDIKEGLTTICTTEQEHQEQQYVQKSTKNNNNKCDLMYNIQKEEKCGIQKEEKCGEGLRKSIQKEGIFYLDFSEF